MVSSKAEKIVDFLMKLAGLNFGPSFCLRDVLGYSNFNIFCPNRTKISMELYFIQQNYVKN